MKKVSFFASQSNISKNLDESFDLKMATIWNQENFASFENIWKTYAFALGYDNFLFYKMDDLEVLASICPENIEFSWNLDFPELANFFQLLASEPGVMNLDGFFRQSYFHMLLRLENSGDYYSIIDTTPRTKLLKYSEVFFKISAEI